MELKWDGNEWVIHDNKELEAVNVCNFNVVYWMIYPDNNADIEQPLHQSLPTLMLENSKFHFNMSEN